MLRFFRKYQKPILAVGGSILLVIFLVPTAIQGIGNYAARRGTKIAHYTSYTGEEKQVSAEEYDRAQRDLAVFVDGSRAFGVPPLVALGIGVIDSPDYWLLLVDEAQANGLIAQGFDDARQAAAIIAQQYAQFAQQLGVQALLEPDEVIAQLARASSVHPNSVADALRRAMGVRRLAMLYGGGVNRISTIRLAAAAQEMLPGIDARTLVIAARADEPATEDDSEKSNDEDDVPEEEPSGGDSNRDAERRATQEANDNATDDTPPLTDDQLQAQLDKYAEVAAGEGERGFGYRLPDRVQLEWLEVKRDRVRDSLQDSERLSRLELRKYWLRNQDNFAPPGAIEETTFDAVEDRVRQRLLDDLTVETLDSITRFIEGEISRTTRELDREGTYFVLPEQWDQRRTNFFDLANRVQEQFDMLPGYQRRGDQWYSADEARRLEGVGRALTSRYGQRMTVADLIPLLQEFGGSDTIFLQQGVAGDPLALSDGSVYFFRITQTEESRPPTSIDEVREELVRDLRRLRAYDALVARREEIRQLAITEGMAALAADHNSFANPQQNIGYAPEGSAMARFYRTFLMPPVRQDADTIKAVVERSRAVLVSMVESRRTFEDLSLDEKTFVVESPQKLALVVVQLTDLRPVVRERVPFFAQTLKNDLFLDEIERGSVLPSFDELSERRGYQLVRQSSGDDDDPDDAAASKPNGN